MTFDVKHDPYLEGSTPPFRNSGTDCTEDAQSLTHCNEHPKCGTDAGAASQHFVKPSQYAIVLFNGQPEISSLQIYFWSLQPIPPALLTTRLRLIPGFFLSTLPKSVNGRI
jgi:hypothetical protein